MLYFSCFTRSITESLNEEGADTLGKRESIPIVDESVSMKAWQGPQLLKWTRIAESLVGGRSSSK